LGGGKNGVKDQDGKSCDGLWGIIGGPGGSCLVYGEIRITAGDLWRSVQKRQKLVKIA